MDILVGMARAGTNLAKGSSLMDNCWASVVDGEYSEVTNALRSSDLSKDLENLERIYLEQKKKS